MNRSGATRIGRLIVAGAFTEAALLLIELEIPAWKIRRLACEGGEWLCALSRRPQLPLALDDMAEATHRALPLAMLRALVEVRRRTAAVPQPIVPMVALLPEHIVCCDDFA